MKLRETFAVVLVLAAVLGMAFVGGCNKDKPAENSSAVKIECVNTKCPIMGSVINPENVTADLVREFKGEKVAFCCAGCPDKWDALSDEEKIAKLSASK